MSPSESAVLARAPVHVADFLAASRRDVDGFLQAALPAPGGTSDTLAEAIRHAVFAGGKRIRPALALASAVAVGGRARDALPVAAALEMLHTYSLIHDDLPCMDDDDLRRGQPTVHVRFGEAAAVLAGDALHTLAFDTVANCALPGAVRLECVRRLAAAAGPEGMVGGQILDMEGERQPPDAEGLEAIHRKKTGALISASAALGGLAGRGSAPQVEALAAFGRELGLLFQIVDDLLDEEATSDRLGKSAGKDRAAGKATYPAIHGLEAARAEAARRAALAETLLDEIPGQPGQPPGEPGPPPGEPRQPPDETGLDLLRALTGQVLHRSA